MTVVLEFLGLQQHVDQVAEHGQRQDKKRNHHGEAGLDVVEKIDRFVEEPEAGQADDGEQWNHQDGCHSGKGCVGCIVFAGLPRADPI